MSGSYLGGSTILRLSDLRPASEGPTIISKGARRRRYKRMKQAAELAIYLKEQQQAGLWKYGDCLCVLPHCQCPTAHNCRAPRSVVE
jgi:hypothetical protein